MGTVVDRDWMCRVVVVGGVVMGRLRDVRVFVVFCFFAQEGCVRECSGVGNCTFRSSSRFILVLGMMEEDHTDLVRY
jgi:hypothetical protein